jgi:hypothetical protein
MKDVRKYKQMIPAILRDKRMTLMLLMLFLLQGILPAQYALQKTAGTTTQNFELSLTEDDCPEELILSDDESGTETYMAFNIISTARILPNSNITYTAMESITLNTGFFASSEENSSFFGQLSDDICSSVVSTENMMNTNSDKEFLKVYPNPFHETTTFSFYIDENQHISMLVYDMNGQLKEVLIQNKIIDPGKYEIRYDGSSLSGGMYYCVLKGSSVQTVKFMISE